jgi:hypothetical protein
MRRITLRQQGTNPSLASYNRPMPLPQANSIFRIDDDLAYDRPEKDKSLPASQFATTVPSAVSAWGRRQTDGNVSWFATVVPKFDVSGAATDEFTLSVVMCYERPNDLDVIDVNRERVLTGYWQDPSAATGGEMKLRWPSTAPEFKLRPNDWVLVSGSQVVPQLGGVITRFQWYRVADCDADAAEELDNSGAPTGYHELYVTLMGQDWNMSSTSPPNVPGQPLTTPLGQVDVTIVQGAFAVYEKTIRLDYGSTF